MENKIKSFGRLLTIMDELRDQCPWDQKQTLDSLRYLTIEEMYELSDAILEKDMEEIKKELGDVLLHIVFYSRIASETNDFDIFDVIGNGEQSKEYDMMEDEQTQLLRRIIAELPNEQKEVLIMRHYEDLSFKEIAEKTGVSINTALGRMRYALINIRKLLEENNVDLTIN